MVGIKGGPFIMGSEDGREYYPGYNWREWNPK